MMVSREQSTLFVAVAFGGAALRGNPRGWLFASVMVRCRFWIGNVALNGIYEEWELSVRDFPLRNWTWGNMREIKT